MKAIINLFFYTLFFSSFWSQTTVFETGFDNGIPTSMSLVNNDLNTPNDAVSEYTEAWICVSDPENQTDSVAASTSWFTPVDTADRWLITPALALGSYGNAVKWNAKSQDASFPDDYYVLVSTSGTDLSNFTDTIGYIQQENFEWIERSVNLSELGYDDQTIYIAFVLRTYDGFKLYIDDILVTKEDDASIGENSLGDIVIYPNPCQDILHIQSEAFLEKVLILDLSGKLVLKSTSNVINVQSLEMGSYMVRVYTNGRIINQPVYIR